MDYPCGKFGDCSFSRFSSVVRTITETDTQTDADERFTPATFVGVSNNGNNNKKKKKKKKKLSVTRIFVDRNHRLLRQMAAQVNTW